MVAAVATRRDAPTYRAMFEIPDAAPTWCGGTEAVAAEDAQPLDSPIPIAAPISGSTKAPYPHDPVTKISTPNPAVVITNPTQITAREPIRTARRLTNGATSTIPAAVGKVASPA